MRSAVLLTLTVMVVVTLASAGHKTKEPSEEVVSKRPKRFAAGISPIGIFSFILKLFKFGWDIGQDVQRAKAVRRQEQQLTKMQSQMESVKLELVKVQSSIGQLERNIGAELHRFVNEIKFSTALAAQTSSVLRMSELTDRFLSLNMSETEDIHDWIGLMLTDNPHGVQTVLYNIHMLVVGHPLLERVNLFQLFYAKCADDENQSRLWKTEAFADLYLTKQMELYGLWIKALKFQNGTKIAKKVKEAERLRDARLHEQLNSLDDIRNMSGAYQVAVDGQIESRVKHLCADTPNCLARGYILVKEGDSSRIEFGCHAESGRLELELADECNPAAIRAKRHTKIFSYHRLLSTKMLVVPDPILHAIFGVSIREETVGGTIYVRLSANVCWKNVSGEVQLVSGVPTLQSDNSALRGIRWPYRLASAKLPLSDGWVTGVGLDITEDKSIILTHITDYFPSPLLKQLLNH